MVKQDFGRAQRVFLKLRLLPESKLHSLARMQLTNLALSAPATFQQWYVCLQASNARWASTSPMGLGLTKQSAMIRNRQRFSGKQSCLRRIMACTMSCNLLNWLA